MQQKQRSKCTTLITSETINTRPARAKHSAHVLVHETPTFKKKLQQHLRQIKVMEGPFITYGHSYSLKINYCNYEDCE